MKVKFENENANCDCPIINKVIEQVHADERKKTLLEAFELRNDLWRPLNHTLENEAYNIGVNDYANELRKMAGTDAK